MQNNGKKQIKINLPGGVVAAGDLYEILVLAQNAGATQIRFGNRQQLYFEIDASELDALDIELLKAGVDYEADAAEYPNMVSSYIADGIFNQENWLKEGVYKDVFDLFNYKPRLKINIVDGSQTFAPFFTGNLNFISSSVSNYWYLQLRYPKTNILYSWPSLIYSEDIPAIAKAIEEVVFANKQMFYDQPEIDSNLLHQMVSAGEDFVIQQIDQPLKLPDFQLPYYEGFNKQGNKYWLGIYRRDELFAIELLQEVCNLCMQTRVGQLYVSPWKSLLIKNIGTKDRPLWGNILDKYRINVRHASNELNWQVEDLCNQCLQLKQQLVREFEEADLRTYRLSFVVKRSPKAGLYGSIIIREEAKNLYVIAHTQDFNPNTKEVVIYQKGILREQLSKHLIALCDRYYAEQTNITQPDKPVRKSELKIEQKQAHQCSCCLTIYDAAYGDQQNGVEPGSPFESLDYYSCPVCESGKDKFNMVLMAIAISI
ncbi:MULTISPECIES: rubredoxin domain-containing protein [unclassified Mucilaginibacter]|uniref:rubredoxin domain-containing protein n=1 Tax=unclassified Mucilaginibacter TaxID=2617802 RepID=UPI002AC9CEA5|nr:MULTISPECIES: rubredoxin domain-containing protein [unclassified Mucilaginibacter]MEB0261914.1 rubredoxin domain-containing protein [Mucilaginibacter sp. 10I4]MEB0277643.1 rubredoxin domain-containing protein [Mucilaginibacter sp. 10B2]MEB0299558.1 rubredoxin domain-containing protein [Mucilaginibacter sp. 5C4]WPX24729.1 rubredoxin domain-containing protein [Mucilaginibacter sp. 5C4]